MIDFCILAVNQYHKPMDEDLIESARNSIKERFRNPFYGAFLISWLLWNWQIPYITFFVSQDNIDPNRLGFIQEKLTHLEYTIAYPLLSALTIALVMPFALNQIDRVIQIAHRSRRINRNKYKDMVTLTVEEFAQFSFKTKIDCLYKQLNALDNYTKGHPNNYVELFQLISASDPLFIKVVCYHLDYLLHNSMKTGNKKDTTDDFIFKILIAKRFITVDGGTYFINQEGMNYIGTNSLRHLEQIDMKYLDKYYMKKLYNLSVL